MKKAISMMLATAMAATCLAGCGSAASSSAAASSEAASSEATSAATSEASTGEKTFENNELNIAVFEGGYGSEYWDEIIKRFEAAYPGVTVNMQISPKIGDIIRPQIVAGNVPDFISMNDNDSTGLISSMVKEHALMDLSDVFEEGGIDDDTPLKDQSSMACWIPPSALLTATARSTLPRLMPARWVWFTTRPCSKRTAGKRL